MMVLLKKLRIKFTRKFNNKNLMRNNLFNNADEFIKHYNNLYRQYWNTRYDLQEENTIGALFEAEFIGRKFFGITEEAFQLVKYRVENE